MIIFLCLVTCLIDLKYILIIIFCVSSVFNSWRYNESDYITINEKNEYGRLMRKFSVISVIYLFFASY